MVTTESISDKYLHVNSCGIQHLGDRDHLTVRPNGRIDYHFLYITAGRCEAEVLGESVTLLPGDLVFFAPGEKQQYAFAAADNSVSCYVHFSGRDAEAIFSMLHLDSSRVLRLGKSRTLESAFSDLFREFYLKKPYYEDLCAAKLAVFFAQCARRLSYQNTPMSGKKRSELDAVCEKMLAECAEPHPLSYYAEFCHLSVSRFSHLFAAGIGMTPGEYLNTLRLEQAKTLLFESDLPIGTVALRAGFSDANYFSRLFRKRFGQSPSSFRKNA